MGQNAEKKDNDDLTLTPLDEMDFSESSNTGQDKPNTEEQSSEGLASFEINDPTESESNLTADSDFQDFNQMDESEAFPSIEDEIDRSIEDTSKPQHALESENTHEPSVVEAEVAAPDLVEAGLETDHPETHYEEHPASTNEPPKSELLTRDPSFGPEEDEDRSLNLEEVRDFAEQEQLKPNKKEFFPYSILIRNIRYEEDIQLILTALKKTEMDFDFEGMKKQAERGKLLVPRVSEYVAMFIAHQIRSIDAEILAAPSDEIPLAYQKERTGPHFIRKKKHDYDKQYSGRVIAPTPEGAKDIIVTTGPNVPEKSIFQFKGVLSHSELFKMTNLESPNLDSYTQQVVETLKKKAHERSCHGIVGLQIHPSETSMGLRIFVSGTGVQFKRSSDHS
jgi:uncharacterized protein YbjQ (UPF0145 family)